jgi:hypothetical protein
MRGVFLCVIPMEESEIIYREKGCLILQIEQTPFSLLPLLLTSLGYTMEMFRPSIHNLTIHFSSTFPIPFPSSESIYVHFPHQYSPAHC